MTSEQPYPCCDKMNGPAWIDGRYCRPVCEVHGYQTEPEARQHQTSELIERVTRAFRAEEKLNWNLELGNDDDVADLARIAIAAMQANTAEQAAELAKFKALAETMAEASAAIIKLIGEKDCRLYASDRGVIALANAVREYKEARDAS